jgi:hypothetical protein
VLEKKVNLPDDKSPLQAKFDLCREMWGTISSPSKYAPEPESRGYAANKPISYIDVYGKEL